MPEIPIKVLQEACSLEELCETVAKLQKQLRYVINGQMDFENIRVKGIVADNIDVKELSAISADLGKITAGEIYGTYIATAEATYPRAEMSNTNNLFSAYLDSDSYIQMDSDRLGVPTLVFQEGLINTLIAQIAGVGFSVIPTSGNMFINAQSGSLVLSGNAVRINSLFSAPLDSITQSNSSASTVAGLVADFNTLLGNLRSMNILA